MSGAEAPITVRQTWDVSNGRGLKIMEIAARAGVSARAVAALVGQSGSDDRVHVWLVEKSDGSVDLALMDSSDGITWGEIGYLAVSPCSGRAAIGVDGWISGLRAFEQAQKAAMVALSEVLFTAFDSVKTQAVLSVEGLDPGHIVDILLWQATRLLDRAGPKLAARGAYADDPEQAADYTQLLSRPPRTWSRARRLAFQLDAILNLLLDVLIYSAPLTKVRRFSPDVTLCLRAAVKGGLLGVVTAGVPGLLVAEALEVGLIFTALSFAMYAAVAAYRELLRVP